MEIQAQRIRLYELSRFLACSPLEVQDAKTYLKLQRLRKSLEKANSDLQDRMDSFRKRQEEEAKPFRQALSELKLDPEAMKAKAAEFDAQVIALMREEFEELQAYLEKEGKEKLSVVVDSEEWAQARMHFEKLVKNLGNEVSNGARFWSDPEAYIEIAELLGVK